RRWLPAAARRMGRLPPTSARTSPAGSPSPTRRSFPGCSMPESHRGLHVVPPELPPETPPRRRRPGAAVLVVLLYGALFPAGLWWFRSRSPLFTRSQVAPSPSRPVAQSEARRGDGATGRQGDNREFLRSGAGLIGAAREEYLRRIATECCSCGCDLSLERCLATEKTCPESPPRAAAIFEELR